MKLLIIAVILGILVAACYTLEPFYPTSPATLTQLVARGPQDVYLTGYGDNIEPSRE